MQPIKITLQGDYVDCQIYRGRLYLWTFNGELKVIKWEDLVHSLMNLKTDPNTLRFAFLEGAYLYNQGPMRLFSDKDYKKILTKKFQLQSQKEYSLSELELNNFQYGIQSYPENRMPTDTEIYRNNLYFITEDGLFSTLAHQYNKKKPVRATCNKHWDCNLLSIKANKYPQLALSGGSEGLFELDISIDSNYRFLEPAQISKEHSSFANYAFWSVYNSSLVDNSSLALFSFEKLTPSELRSSSSDIFEDGNVYDPMSFLSDRSSRRNKDTSSIIAGKYRREFQQSISEQNIFSDISTNDHLSWGVDDKIYRAADTGFEIVRFNNYAVESEGEKRFTLLDQIQLMPWKGKVIGGGTSYFGTIIECENALIVLQSDGNVYNIPGPITRWRVYPRSLNFENQLHVILEDRIEIYSFNHDYFLDQNQKHIGSEYKQPKSRFGGK